MPNSNTFEIPVIRDLVQGYLAKSTVSVDPFARNKRWATHTNDLNPKTEAEHHLEAREFLQLLVNQKVQADFVLFDPPYSPRQISECYTAAGLTAGMKETQNAALYKGCRDRINLIALPGCVALCFGCNSCGMGGRWGIEEILLVAHGGAHNDTICTVCRLPEDPIG